MTTELVEFNELKAKVAEFVGPTAQITVTDTASNAVAMGTLKTIKTLAGEIEARRTALVKPMNDHVKAINGYAKQIAEPLEKAEADIKTKMAKWATEERARIAAEEKRIREEQEAKQREAEKKKKEDQEAMAAFGADDDPAPEARDESKAIAQEANTKVAMLNASRPKNTREVPKFEITDAAQVPDEFWAIDQTLIGAAVRGGRKAIPGVRIWMETTIVAR